MNPLIVNDSQQAPTLQKEISDADYFFTVDHPMEKDHYLLFVAYVNYDRVFLYRLYPEQSPSFRLPIYREGILYLCCSRDGLFAYPHMREKK